MQESLATSAAVIQLSKDRYRNWLFADTVSVARASADIYMVKTARANDLEPSAYLCRLFAELPVAQTVEQSRRCYSGTSSPKS
jgi:hypothetical protein